MGGLGMPVCAPRRGGSHLFPYGRTGHSSEGLLRRAKPAVSAGQEFSDAASAGGAGDFAGALWVASHLLVAGAWSGCPVWGASVGLVGIAGPLGVGSKLEKAVAKAA